MAILESTEDQYDKAQKPYANVVLEIGSMAEMYHTKGCRRVKIVRVINTELETLKVYEVKSADGSIHHATSENLFSLGGIVENGKFVKNGYKK